jgi:hypothetical protein
MIFQIAGCIQSLKKRIFKGKEAASVDVCSSIFARVLVIIMGSDISKEKRLPIW